MATKWPEKEEKKLDFSSHTYSCLFHKCMTLKTYMSRVNIPFGYNHAQNILYNLRDEIPWRRCRQEHGDSECSHAQINTHPFTQIASHSRGAIGGGKGLQL